MGPLRARRWDAGEDMSSRSVAEAWDTKHNINFNFNFNFQVQHKNIGG